MDTIHTYHFAFLTDLGIHEECVCATCVYCALNLHQRMWTQVSDRPDVPRKGILIRIQCQGTPRQAE